MPAKPEGDLSGTPPAKRDVHRPLTGAAKTAHDAKARGEKVIGGGRGANGRQPAAAAARSSSSGPTAGGILERIRRVI